MASPGPNVLLVARTAMADSRRAGLAAAAGVATGAGLWAAAAALGLALVLARSPDAYAAVRVLGGLYLVWLGARTFARAGRPFAIDGAGAAGRLSRRAWREGALTNLSNPKAAVFYLSIFATLLPTAAGTGFRLAAIAVIVAGASGFHALLAYALSTRRARAGYLRAKPAIDRTAGLVMAAFGVVFVLNLG